MFILDINYNDFYDFTTDWIMIGLTKIFVIIAVLQIVKKIPDIINTIFGTHIQSRGGIKGRLGEMAGIGGIAQKAWTSLGTGAKNLAKLGLTAVPSVLGAGANFAYKQKTGKNLTDLKAVRGMRAAGKGLGTALKTGSWLKGYEEGKTTFDKVSTDPRDKARFMQKTNEEMDDILTPKGADGKRKVSAVKDQDFNRKRDTNKTFEQNVERIGGSDVVKAHKNYEKAARRNSMANQIAKYDDTVVKNMEQTMARFEEGSKDRNKLSSALEAYKATGNQVELADFVKSNEALFDPTVKGNLVGANGALTSKERALNFIITHTQDFDYSKADLENLKRGISAVGFVASTSKESVDKAKSDLDLEIAGASLSELDKFELNANISNSIDLVNSEAFAIGRKDSENGMASATATDSYKSRGSLGSDDDFWGNLRNYEEEIAKRLLDLREKARTSGLNPTEEAELNNLLNRIKELQKKRNNKS